MAQTITIDLTPDGRRIFQRPYLYFSQGDVGQEFVINLKSRFGLEIPAGATVKIEATKPSGFGFSETGVLSNQTATFTTAAIMTDEAGHFPVELSITASGKILGTANFNFMVEPDPHPEGTTDGQAEEVIPELTQLVERVEDAASSVLDRQTVTNTLPAGSQASYSFDEETNTQTFGIPQGEAGAGSAGVVANAYSASSTYVVGDCVIHNSNLYRCTTAITTAEAFTSAHWTRVVLADDISDLKSVLNYVADGEQVIGFVQGSRSQSTPTVVNENSARVTTANPLFLRKGDILSVVGTYTGIKYTIVGKGTTNYQREFATVDYRLIIPYDGTYFVNVAKTDGTSSIIPSEATITVTTTNKNNETLQRHDDSINANLMGIDLAENLYQGADTWTGNWIASDSSSVSFANEMFGGYPVIYMAGTWRRYFKNIPVESSKTYTFSVWVKAPTTTSIIVYITHSGTASPVATVSPSNKSYNGTITADTWTKLSVTFTCSASGNVSPHVITGYGEGLYIAKYILNEGNKAVSISDELSEKATKTEISGVGDYIEYSFTRPTSESAVYWNPEIVKTIPNGTKVKFVFDSYSGSYLYRIRIDGKKTNNSYDEAVGSITNPSHGGEIEFTASTEYKALRLHVQLSQEETGITMKCLIATNEKLGITNELMSMQKARVIHVDKNGNGDFTSFVDAINYACQFMDSVVYVGAGTYDLLDELGDDYLDSASSTNMGLVLKNRVHVIGTSQTVLEMKYTGSSADVKEYISPINAGTHGFTLENIIIDDENVRYSIHDDLGGAGSTPYTNKIINCTLIHKTGHYSDCIGGGLGENAYIEIRGCYLEGDSGRPRLAYYHGNNNSSVTNAIGRITVCDNYFAQDGTFKLTKYGNSQTVSKAYVSNNSFGSEPTVDSGSSAPYDNMEMIKWNNVIRT